ERGSTAGGREGARAERAGFLRFRTLSPYPRASHGCAVLRRRYLPPLRGGLIRGALPPNRRLGEGTPLLGQWGRGQCRTRGSGWSRGTSCWWERLPPTSRLTSFGGRNLPPFACGSGGQSQGCAVLRRRYLPPLRGGLIRGGFVPQPKVGGRDPTAGAVGEGAVSNPWIRLVARAGWSVGPTAPYLPPHFVRRQEPSPFRLRLRGTKPGLRRAPAAVPSPASWGTDPGG